MQAPAKDKQSLSRHPPCYSYNQYALDITMCNQTQIRHEHSTNNCGQRRTEHRSHVDIVADITTWNSERKDM